MVDQRVQYSGMKKKKETKKKSKKTSSKFDKIPSGSIDQRVQYAGMRKKKKKYTKADTGALARSKKAMTSDKAYALPFGETFRQAKKAGKETFRWKSKSYHTKTKDELEKATGKSEKERFDRAAKAKKATPEKKGLFSKIATKLRGGHETQEAYETAKVARKKAKRIANLEARKAAGKSYSKKNLAALKGAQSSISS